MTGLDDTNNSTIINSTDDNNSSDNSNVLQVYQNYSNLGVWLRSFIGHIIILEGLISAGKTTLGRSLTKLFQQHNIKVIFFIEYKNDILLEVYIENMAQEAYGYQIMMLRERIHIYELAQQYASQGYVVIIDRSKAGDLAFALMQKDKGYFSVKQWTAYQQVLQTPTQMCPSIIAYLDVNPHLAYQRMLVRDDKCEVKGYDEQYFIDLHQAYQQAQQHLNVKMQYLDWSTDYEVVDNYLDDKITVNFLQWVFKHIYQIN